MNTEALAERVTAGAAYLDRVLPGWEHHVDVDALDLGSECRCVLGQLVVDHHADNIADGNAILDETEDTLTILDTDGEPYGGTSAYSRWIHGDDPGLVPGLTAADARRYGFLAYATAGIDGGFAEMAAEHDALTAIWRRLVLDRTVTTVAA